MKVRIPKVWNPLADGYQLTKQDIESQVLSDLAKYRERYQERYGKPAPSPLDVDNYVKELWDFDVSFESMTQDSEEEEALGCLRPETQEVVVDESCTNQKRISFTIAHEAGHLSLHGPLFARKNGVIIGWSKDTPSSGNKKKLGVAATRREWQADVYAAALLAPGIAIYELLEELGLARGTIVQPFNLDQHLESFSNRFGLSRHALEIRLSHLNISFQGARHLTV